MDAVAQDDSGASRGAGADCLRRAVRQEVCLWLAPVLLGIAVGFRRRIGVAT